MTPLLVEHCIVTSIGHFLPLLILQLAIFYPVFLPVSVPATQGNAHYLSCTIIIKCASVNSNRAAESKVRVGRREVETCRVRFRAAALHSAHCTLGNNTLFKITTVNWQETRTCLYRRCAALENFSGH